MSNFESFFGKLKFRIEMVFVGFLNLDSTGQLTCTEEDRYIMMGLGSKRVVLKKTMNEEVRFPFKLLEYYH